MMNMKITCGWCSYRGAWQQFDPDTQTPPVESYDPSGNCNYNREGHTWVCPKCRAAVTPPTASRPIRIKPGKESMRA